MLKIVMIYKINKNIGGGVMNLLFIVIGTFLIIVGSLVWYFKLLEITPGFNGKNIKNRKAMARWVGVNYILMGCGFIISTIIASYYNLGELLKVIIFTVILYIFIIIIYYGYKKYTN